VLNRWRSTALRPGGDVGDGGPVFTHHHQG
jgi:hypothetical protein